MCFMNLERGVREPEALWEYIKYLRKTAGYKMGEFSGLIGCSFVHGSRIEKPFHRTHIAPSIRLLKKVAKVCAKNSKERKILEEKLLFKRARLFFAKDVVEDTLDQLTTSTVSSIYGLQFSSESMPKGFIERLRQDTENISEDSTGAKTSLPREILNAVLQGKLSLSAQKVTDLAKKLKQPEEDYMLLAGYLPDGLRRLTSDKDFMELIRISAKLSPGEFEKLGTTLRNILSLIKQSPPKKKEGK